MAFAIAQLFPTLALAQSKLGLTTEERAYLIDKKQITMCVDPNWMPFEEINEAGQHVGVAADFIREFAEDIGVPIVLVKTETWKESLDYIKAGKCDILSLLNESEERKKFLNFTRPYLQAATVLVARDDVFYLDGVGALSGKTLGIVAGYVYEEKIRNRYPDVKIVPVKSLDDGLRQVSDGKIFATIDTLLIVTRHIQKLGFNNLKVAGHTDLDNAFRVGIRKDDLLLHAIFDKAVKNMPESRRNRILQQWYTVSFEHKTDWTLTFQLLVVVVFILFVVAYGYVSQRKLSAQLAEANDLLQEKNHELEYISQTDPLTDTYNRIKANDELIREMERAKRYGLTFSLILFDVDHFKEINDTHGHQTGDAVLMTLVKTVKNNIRKLDILGRWGGEEFIIICPETSEDGARGLAENLRQKISEINFPNIKQVTASFGIATYDPKRHPDHKDIISHADLAMYDAKGAGRNKVRVFKG